MATPQQPPAAEQQKSDEKTEETPLVAGDGESAKGERDVMRTVGLATAVITFSVGLINFNRYLMQDTRFPYAAPLVLIHMGFISTFSSVLLVLRPSLFPALTDPDQRVPLDQQFFLRGALPIGACFSASLILANLAYKHLSMAFLQMLKESGIITVYGFSLLAGLESFSFRHLQIISMALLGASLTVKGELNFVMTGFLIQMSSQLCECARIVLQSNALSGRKLDALSYVLLICPVCFVLLGLLMGLLAFLPAGSLGAGLLLPSWDVLMAWAPVLLLNCFVAFGLNVSIALLIKHTSAMTYIFCGVLKDVIAVMVGVLLVGEEVTHLQIVAFCIQVASVAAWSSFKSRPGYFEDGLAFGLTRVMFGFPRQECGGSSDHVLSAAGADRRCADLEASHGGKAV